jgi:hypothetical protein
MVHSKNYINKDGKNPEPGIAMYGKNVVLSKEELLDDKWLFCNDDPEITARAKMQVKGLQFFNDWIAIID